MNLLQFTSVIDLLCTLSRIESVFKFKLKGVSHNILQDNNDVVLELKNETSIHHEAPNVVLTHALFSASTVVYQPSD